MTAENNQKFFIRYSEKLFQPFSEKLGETSSPQPLHEM